MSNTNEEFESRRRQIIDEITKNRAGLYELLQNNISERNSLNKFTLIPEDFRSRVGAMSKAAEIAKTKNEVNKSELDIRKTIDQSIKTEYELLFKFEKEKINDNKSISVDIRELSNQLKKFEEDNQKTTTNKKAKKNG